MDFFKGKKVLVADDMYVNRRIISEMLTAAGAVVETAVGGLDAVSMALSEKFDLILMDMIMPVVDGPTAAQQIRHHGIDTPMIGMTSHPAQDVTERALDSGMLGCLTKPLDLGSIVNLLRYPALVDDTVEPYEKPWLKLMYITNRPEVAAIAQKYGVDRIWIDLESRGKAERQPGNTVKSDHTIDDIRNIKPLLSQSEMLVRIQPWSDESPAEIDEVIAAGADIIMLPMWKTPGEVSSFVSAVAGRVKTTLLLETREALECIDDVLSIGGFDEIHIGLNDLHLSYGMDFMFQPLADGKVEMLCDKFRAAGIPYGFGGIARLGYGDLKAEKVIMEHLRLGSTRAILSRSFCDANRTQDPATIESLFADCIRELYHYEAYCKKCDAETLEKNKQEVAFAVEVITAAKRGS